MEEEFSEFDLIRQKNIQERNAMIAALLDDPELKDALESIKTSVTKRKKRVKIERSNDGAFKFSGNIPMERRSSARLQNKKPDFTYRDLPDENESVNRGNRSEFPISDLEAVVYRVRTTRTTRMTPNPIIPVEMVTQSMLDAVHLHGEKKRDDTKGTSCHQCRQKTVDTKTMCRSGRCYGVRGQFCGICVINRYGEDPIKALLDPKWSCYVCRGVCNCSFCRAKAGKRPTGVLTPIAHRNGFKSVHEFLVNLAGYGDYSDPRDDPEAVLGFDNDNVILKGYRIAKLTIGEVAGEPDWGNDALLGFEGDEAVLKEGRINLEPNYSNHK